MPVARVCAVSRHTWSKSQTQTQTQTDPDKPASPLNLPVCSCVHGWHLCGKIRGAWCNPGAPCSKRLARGTRVWRDGSSRTLAPVESEPLPCANGTQSLLPAPHVASSALRPCRCEVVYALPSTTGSMKNHGQRLQATALRRLLNNRASLPPGLSPGTDGQIVQLSLTNCGQQEDLSVEWELPLFGSKRRRTPTALWTCAPRKS